MPTGYTAGILDGKVKTFPEFAKLCMKAFGACVHMRDENMDAEYKPIIPSTYYKKELEQEEKKLKKIKSYSDYKIIRERTKQLEERKAYAEKRILEITDNRNKLESFMKDAQTYIPPTTDHTGVKKFMIEQLQTTIDHDGSTEYYDKELIEIQNQLNNIDVVKLRTELITQCEEEIDRCACHYQEEVERCNENNKWVTDFLNSINENNKS